MSDSPLFTSSLLDIPRPYIDPVSSSTEALGIAGLIFERPRQECTAVVVLDTMQRGIHLNRFAPLALSTLHEIIADCSELFNPHSVVLLSSRRSSHSLTMDLQLGHLAHTMLHNAGLKLLHWMVAGPGEIYCPVSWNSSSDSWSTTSWRR